MLAVANRLVEGPPSSCKMTISRQFADNDRYTFKQCVGGSAISGHYSC